MGILGPALLNWSLKRRSRVGGRCWWRNDWGWSSIARISISCSVIMVGPRVAILWPLSPLGNDMSICFAIIAKFLLALWSIMPIILAAKALDFTEVSALRVSFFNINCLVLTRSLRDNWLMFSNCEIGNVNSISLRLLFQIVLSYLTLFLTQEFI